MVPRLLLVLLVLLAVIYAVIFIRWDYIISLVPLLIPLTLSTSLIVLRLKVLPWWLVWPGLVASLILVLAWISVVFIWKVLVKA